MSEGKRIDPKTIWMVEQAHGAWLVWHGTEEDMREFFEPDGIRAVEYTKTGRVMNDHKPLLMIGETCTNKTSG